jgi:hypothetical protein
MLIKERNIVRYIHKGTQILEGYIYSRNKNIDEEYAYKENYYLQRIFGKTY